ncbi:SubName: Full=Uncharacterized protein {ECO:0000313/EMBL:CCA75826.1} [Serendipita indica DSM 11827]|nr:SubName: Full=Uncharacterized protein {ECO:0000313/EMBL:CCA75826.1} [Serendipita indica DSM 11827]
MAGSLVHRGLAEFLEAAIHFRATDYTALAGFTVWAYDILLTLDEELTLLWSRKGSVLLKTIYILNRYLPILGFGMVVSSHNPILNLAQNPQMPSTSHRYHSVSDCRGYHDYQASRPAIFIIRLYSIYVRHPRIQVLLVGIMAASHLTLVVITINMMVVAAKTMYYNPLLRACIADVSRTLGGYYIVPIFVESVIAFATLYHALAFRQHRTTMRQTPTTAILNALYIDGFWFYLYALCLRVALCLVYWNAASTLVLVLCYLEYGLTSTITSRWFLKFRKLLIDSWETSSVSRDTRADVTDLTNITGAAIDFASRRRFNSMLSSQGSAGSIPNARPTPSTGKYAPAILSVQEEEHPREHHELDEYRENNV